MEHQPPLSDAEQEYDMKGRLFETPLGSHFSNEMLQLQDLIDKGFENT